MNADAHDSTARTDSPAQSRGLRTVLATIPPGWFAWAPDDIEGARQRALEFATDEERAALMAAVATFQKIVEDEVPGTTIAALWIPDLSGPLLATAAVRILASEGPERWDLETTLAFVRSQTSVGRGMKLLDVATTPTCTPLGDAVLQVLDMSKRFRRRVTREWAWFILPRGTNDIVAFQVQSDHLGAFEQLGDIAAEIAHSLTVEFEPS